MALQNTNLYVQMAALPATFVGSPQDLAAAMVARMKIVSPGGVSFIVTGDIAPTSNVGPWLKGGTQWYVWSEDTKQYVPQDLSASLTLPFWESNSTPPGTSPDVWLQTTQDATDTNPSHGEPIGWFQWNGTAWAPIPVIVNSGNSASRPGSPVNFQQYFDTDINVLIWWERGQWRTVSGSPGDVKAVTAFDLATALTNNPGWDLLGRGDVTPRGRIVIQATKDPETVPANNFPPSTGVPEQAAGSVVTGTGVTPSGSSTALVPSPTYALWHLIKL